VDKRANSPLRFGKHIIEPSKLLTIVRNFRLPGPDFLSLDKLTLIGYNRLVRSPGAFFCGNHNVKIEGTKRKYL